MRYGSRARAAQRSGGSARSRRRPGPHSAAAPRAVSTWRSARAPPGQGRAAQPPGGGGQRPAGDILGAALGAAPLRQRQRGAPHGPAAHLSSARRRPGHGADTGGDAITSGPGPPAARPAPGSSEGCGRRGTELEDARGERSFKGHRHERISAFYLRGSWQSSPFCPARTTPRRNCRGPTTSAPRVGGGGRGGETAVRRRSCGPRRGLPSTGALRKRSAGGEKRHSVGRAALQAEFGATPSFWLTYLPANRNAAWKPKWPIVVRRGWGVGMRVRAWALRAVGRLLQDGAGRWLSVARPEGGWAAPRRAATCPVIWALFASRVGDKLLQSTIKHVHVLKCWQLQSSVGIPHSQSTEKVPRGWQRTCISSSVPPLQK